MATIMMPLSWCRGGWWCFCVVGMILSWSRTYRSTAAFVVPQTPKFHDDWPLALAKNRKQAAGGTKKHRPLHHAPRQQNPLAVERQLLQQQSRETSYDYILGSDESGTGCWAGPIVTATVCCLLSNDDIQERRDHWRPSWLIDGVQDCKRLPHHEKMRIYHEVLHHNHIVWTLALRSATEIDAAPTVTHAIADAFQESMTTLVTTQLPRTENGQLPKVFSIVDGPSYPKQVKATATENDEEQQTLEDGHDTPLMIPGRPWPQGDTMVYSVALASILAQVTHTQIMEQEAHGAYPQYGFDVHHGYGGGGPEADHLAALHQYGPAPTWHRQSCKPVQQVLRNTTPRHSEAPEPTTAADTQDHHPKNDGSIDRRDTLQKMALLVTAPWVSSSMINPPAPAQAMYTDSKTGIRLPEKGEIADAVPRDWALVDNPLSDNDKSSLGRLDSTNDAIFYQEPRFVEHVDEQAVKLLTDYIRHQVLEKDDTTAVLDLCSSWTSHFPPSSPTTLTRVAGLGMNAPELKANPSLTEWVVQDLNDASSAELKLPYESNAFDAVLCQLSIDYLTQPGAVCREVGRVLRPGGTVHVLFSNRLFLSKAVALWTGADDIDHAFVVASYFYFCRPGLFTQIQAQDLSVRNKKNGKIVGDPLYVVTAVKA